MAQRSTEMPWADAHALASRVPTPSAPVVVPVEAAAGLVLAEPALAVLAAPPFDAAAMDGYAVVGPGPWQVVGRVLAGGARWTAPLGTGDAVEIGTGAVVPADAEAVVPYERCERVGDVVTGERDANDHIRRSGEDARPGDGIAPAGRLVGATLVAAAAQAGLDALTVHRRPRVVTLVTGDEVVLSGAPGPGQVRDALAPVVAALVARAGGEVVDCRSVRDDADALADAIGVATAVDVVVVTGSSSVGMADHLRVVLGGLGAHWHVDRVASRPGRPQSLVGLPDGRFVVGLPGNPFAGLIAGLTTLEPLVAAIAGRRATVARTAPVVGAAHLLPHAARITPVTLDGEGAARTLPGARSGSLRIAAGADALAVLEPDWTSGSPAVLLSLP